MCICTGQKSTLASFSIVSPSYFIKKDLSLNLELGHLARLADQETTEVFLCSPPSARNTGIGHILLHGHWGSEHFTK